MASMKNKPLTPAGADLGIGAGVLPVQADEETEEQRRKRLALIEQHGMAAAMLLGDGNGYA